MWVFNCYSPLFFSAEILNLHENDRPIPEHCIIASETFLANKVRHTWGIGIAIGHGISRNGEWENISSQLCPLNAQP